MTAPPPTPPADEKDWTWVLTAPCAECGFDAATVHGADVPDRVRDTAERFRRALGRADAAVRPQADIWSPVEYGAHVRDVCRLFDERVRLMLDGDDPRFANWDQDRTAVEDRYWAQSSATVSAELTAAADRIAATFEQVGADQWSRPGRRSNGSVFTVDTLARYFLHDLVHHAHDVGA
jgi:DinB family protein